MGGAGWRSHHRMCDDSRESWQASIISLVKSFFRLVLLALALLVVALVSALTAMRLAIHGHEVAVPDLVGKSPAAARIIAEQNGLELSVERQYYSPTVPEGKILSQLPPSGSQVRRGWEVRVAESLGPQRVAIPSLLGQSERVANINIRRRGLDLGAIAQMQLPDSPEGQVVAQAPPPNASGISAPKISLLVAAPPQAQALVMPSFIGQPLGSVTVAVQDSRAARRERDCRFVCRWLRACSRSIPRQHDRFAKSRAGEGAGRRRR